MRSTFARSRLVRLLDAWTPLEAEAGGMDLAERTSLWFGALDAIRLQAAHQAIRAVRASLPAAGRGVRRASAADLAQELQRVRAVLARAIGQPPSEQDEAVGFGAYHRRHLELQRLMEMTIAPLRDQARHALAHASARLRQLAVLDEAMQQLLAPREQALLPTAAAWLERRFVQLRTAAADAGAGEDAATLRRPGGWLHAFEADWRQALLGELDLRLEPVSGLLEALAQDNEPPR